MHWNLILDFIRGLREARLPSFDLNFIWYIVDCFLLIKAEAAGQLEDDDDDDETFHGDYCKICKDGGELLCCDFCPGTYHMRCVKPQLINVPEGEWKCPMCKVDSLPDKVEKILFWKFLTHHPTGKKNFGTFSLQLSDLTKYAVIWYLWPHLFFVMFLTINIGNSLRRQK